jgi:hypothetical protein
MEIMRYKSDTPAGGCIIQNVHAASRSEFHVLSNGALGFGGRLIFCTGKWRKHFTETLLTFNFNFQHI